MRRLTPSNRPIYSKSQPAKEVVLTAEVVTVSSKYQIVIPSSLRRALDLRPGDQLMVELADGGEVRLRIRPRSYTDALRGLHRDVWRDVDARAYVREERETWGKG